MSDCHKITNLIPFIGDYGTMKYLSDFWRQYDLYK